MKDIQLNYDDYCKLMNSLDNIFEVHIGNLEGEFPCIKMAAKPEFFQDSNQYAKSWINLTEIFKSYRNPTKRRKTMIKPTIGRVVLFNDGMSDQRVPALITYVHSDDKINIGGHNKCGSPIAQTDVHLCQEGEVCQKYQAEWMIFQKGQAKKTEELEEKIAEQTST